MIFSECGAVLHQDDKLIYKNKVTDLIDQTLFNKIKTMFLNMCNDLGFEYVGERVDVRNGLIYLAPVGMKAGDALRSDFINYEAQTESIQKIANFQIKKIRS